jgi:RNA recognition motif-containing protein
MRLSSAERYVLIMILAAFQRPPKRLARYGTLSFLRGVFNMARLYIGNLPPSTTEQELQAWIEEHGFRVESIQVIRDLETGSSRGFGFAELPEIARAQEAVDALNGQRVEGHNVRVSEARPVNLNTEGRQMGTNRISNRSPRRKAS